MSQGIFEGFRGMPKDLREFDRFYARANSKLQYDDNRLIIEGLTRLADRTGTDLTTLLAYLTDAGLLTDDATIETRTDTTFDDMLGKITDDGKAEDQRFLPQVSAGNRLSTQSELALSSTATATSATIDIAAHTVQYGYGLVSFSSGTISGLTTNTLYYVYAQDPDFEGGAVSYLATTNPQTVTADNGRYYVGSITTPLSSTTADIADATSADPIVFETDASHGWDTGQSVEFASLPGDFAVLNGEQKEITKVDGTHFSIDVDGSGFAAYTSGGTATRVSEETTGGGGAGGGGHAVLLP